MADQKISQLTALTGANVADNDAIAIVDTSATETKKIVFSELKNALDTATGFVRITGDTMTGALNVQSTITSDGLTVDGLAKIQGAATGLVINETDTTDLNTYFNANSGDFNLMTTNDAFTSFTTRLNVDHSTGDISFYEDTGSTAKLFWDASAESLGIGTSSLDNKVNIQESALSGRSASNGNTSLTLEHATDTGIQFFSATQTQLRFGDAASTGAGSIIYTHSDDALKLSTNGSERMRISSNGSVGIGTSSPNQLLELRNTSGDFGAEATIRGSTSAGAPKAEIAFKRESSGDDTSIVFRSSDNGTLNASAMTLDHNGNLLVGMTSANTNNDGAGIRADGLIHGKRADVVATFNRKTSDGTVVQIAKDNAVVGSISTHFGSPMFGKAGGARLAFATSSMYPSNDAGTTENGTLDIGTSSGRFKDLYLSSSIDIDAASGARIKFTDTGTQAYTIGNTGTSFNIYNESQSSEAMRLDASGHLLVGKTSSAFGTQGIELQSDGELIATKNGTPIYVNRITTDGAVQNFYKDGSAVGSITTKTGDIIIHSTVSGHCGLRFAANEVLPVNQVGDTTDNACDIGNASTRFDDIFATNGTIQTSDRNEKQDIAGLSDAEQRVAVAAKGLLRKFRWKDAVAEKGDEARTHFGIIAQDLQAAFAAEGLDAGDYAMFISSTWTDEDTGEERTRMGVRYSELLAFIIAAI